MADLPLPTPHSPFRPVADSDRAARLAALRAHRGTAPTGTSELNSRESLAARLDPLLSNNAGYQQPFEGTVAAAPSPRRSNRRHPARGARIASLGLSVVATGGLAAYFSTNGVAAGGTSGSAQIVTATSTAAPVGKAAAADPAIASTLPSVTDTAQATTASTADSTTADTVADTVAAPTTVAGVEVVATTVAPPTEAAVTVVNGATYSSKWGDVQVQATFAADGSLIDVVALATPDADQKSVSINNRAVPTLISDSLTAQTANVDTVSGATYTSDDYSQSLQSAIDAARAAGLTTLA